MPWQQFTVEMAKALAWPVVVFVLLFELRRPLGRMADALANQALRRRLTKLGLSREGLTAEFEGEWDEWPTLPVTLETLNDPSERPDR